MSSTLQKLQESLNAAKEAATKKLEEVTTTNEKILDMWPNTVNQAKAGKQMTTDTGVKVRDTDHWLRVVSDQQEGPALLEDQIAREKIMRCMWPWCCPFWTSH
jgi:catalase